MNNILNHIDENKFWYGKGNVKEKVKQLLYISKKNLHKNLNIKNTNVIIVPHAGLEASGYCTASCFQYFINNNLTPKKKINFENIIILSTSHKHNNLIFLKQGIYNGSFSKIFVPTNKYKKLIDKHNNIKINNNYFKTEHSHKNVIPFVEYCFPNIPIIPILIGDINNFNIIGKDIFNNFKNSLFIFNTDLLHVNGHFQYKLPINNINNDIKNIESKILKPILNRDNILNFNKIIKSENPSICGLNVFKLFLNMPFNNIIGKVCCYYQSNQIDYITKNIFYYPNKVEGSIVSYISCIFTEKDNHNLNNLFTRFEELSLLNYSKSILNNKLNKKYKIEKPFYSPSYQIKKGVFVTLKKNNILRGCIGIISSTDKIINNIHNYTLLSAFNDNRFNPVDKSEINNISYSISLLNETELLNNLDKWKLGLDGIHLNCSNNSAFYLPQVPIEQNWNKIQTLESLCKKGGLEKNCWKNNEDCKLFINKGYEFK